MRDWQLIHDMHREAPRLELVSVACHFLNRRAKQSVELFESRLDYGVCLYLLTLNCAVYS